MDDSEVGGGYLVGVANDSHNKTIHKQQQLPHSPLKKGFFFSKRRNFQLRLGLAKGLKREASLRVATLAAAVI